MFLALLADHDAGLRAVDGESGVSWPARSITTLPTEAWEKPFLQIVADLQVLVQPRGDGLLLAYQREDQFL